MELLCPWQHSREGTSVWAHKFLLLGSTPSRFRPIHLQEVKGSSIQVLRIYSLLYLLTWLSIKATCLRLGLKWAGNFGVTSTCHPSPNLCYFFDFQNWHSQAFSTQTISRISLTVSMTSQQVVFLSCCPVYPITDTGGDEERRTWFFFFLSCFRSFLRWNINQKWHEDPNFPFFFLFLPSGWKWATLLKVLYPILAWAGLMERKGRGTQVFP